jgi:trigger factor
MALLEGCKHELEVTIPAALVVEETERVTLSYQKQAHLPGFRPGKTPLSIIKAKFAGGIKQDVVEKLVPRVLEERFREERLQVVGQPEIKDLQMDGGDEIKFKVTFEVAPEIELGTYRELEVAYDEPTVSDEDVVQQLDRIREQQAQFVNLDPRPAVDGDHVLIDIKSVAGVEGDPVESEDMAIEVGNAETLPEYSEALRGMEPGQEKEVTVAYSEDYGHEKLAGKTVVFSLKLKQLRRKELPELNDDLAKDLGDFQALDDLKSAVRAQIFREREQEARDAAKGKILDKLVESHEFAVPDAYVDRQLENQAQNLIRSLASQGADPRELKIDWDKFRESQRERAVKDVKASMLLDKIGTVESIDATVDEVDRELAVAARRAREAVAVTRKRWESDGTMNRVASNIRTQKVLNFLFDNARKVAN